MRGGAPAWLLDCGGGTVVAVAATSVLHVVEDASLLFRVPLAPTHCNQVLVWQQHVLPVVDLNVLVSGFTTDVTTIARQTYACVLGCRTNNNETEYGVLLLRALPRRISVEDEQSVPPTVAQGESWANIALGFFSYHGRTVPIIDSAIVFGSKQRLLAKEQGGWVAERIA